MTEAVKFSEFDSINGAKIGLATLNKPKALNALSLDMIRLLMPQLVKWRDDPKIAVVMIDGEGDKAFCAGGDVVAMYHAMQATPNAIPDSLQAFFTEEYQLDYLIHTYEKPILVWGNGIVMGGGLGLMSGASHRIVTETSRLAMPEITIGLYPDVGGSWFLNKMPDGCGMFLGLTGASINAADALYVNLADHFIPNDQKQHFFDQIQVQDWTEDVSVNQVTLSELCVKMHSISESLIPQDVVKNHQKLIDSVTNKDTVAEIVETVLELDSAEDKWLSRAQKSLTNGSPITMHLVYQQLERGKPLSLAECFKMELIMSCHCGQVGEFQEGVRALLIDKDGAPNWQNRSVRDVPVGIVEEFFSAPWEDEQHPLAKLGK